MEITIRPIEPEDINYLFDIEIKCYEDVRGLEWWREVIKDKQHYSMAAAVHQVPIGFVVWKTGAYKKEPVARIERLAVKPAFRGKGAGTMLLRDTTIAARTAGLTQLMLLVPERLCFPGHKDDVSQWLLKHSLHAVGTKSNHFESYGQKEDAYIFLGPGPS